jgi:hypothetical protein
MRNCGRISSEYAIRTLLRVTISTARASELQRYSCAEADRRTLWGLPGVAYDERFVAEKEFDCERVDALLGVVKQGDAPARSG